MWPIHDHQTCVLFLVVPVLLFFRMSVVVPVQYSFVGCCKNPDRNRRRSCCIGPIHDFCEIETKAVDARICVWSSRALCDENKVREIEQEQDESRCIWWQIRASTSDACVLPLWPWIRKQKVLFRFPSFSQTLMQESFFTVFAFHNQSTISTKTSTRKNVPEFNSLEKFNLKNQSSKSSWILKNGLSHANLLKFVFFLFLVS